MKGILFGSSAPVCRQCGGELMLAAAKHFQRMTPTFFVPRWPAGPPSRFKPPTGLLETRDAWRTVQVRQLFRLSLEALLHWTITVVADTPKTTNALVCSFLDYIPGAGKYATARAWLTAVRPQNTRPTELISEISTALHESFDDLPKTIIRGLAFSLAEASAKQNGFERPDRLPVSRARREAEARENTKPGDFVRHVLESWVLALHVYWSVGRGLADARAQGKTLLRL